jgi:hypothetical protein
MNVARSTVIEAPLFCRVTRRGVAHRSIVNSIIPSYSQLPARRVGGWVVAFAIALILGSTAFALWAILALH